MSSTGRDAEREEKEGRAGQTSGVEKKEDRKRQDRSKSLAMIIRKRTRSDEGQDGRGSITPPPFTNMSLDPHWCTHPTVMPDSAPTRDGSRHGTHTHKETELGDGARQETAVVAVGRRAPDVMKRRRTSQSHWLRGEQHACPLCGTSLPHGPFSPFSTAHDYGSRQGSGFPRPDYFRLLVAAMRKKQEQNNGRLLRGEAESEVEGRERRGERGEKREEDRERGEEVDREGRGWQEMEESREGEREGNVRSLHGSMLGSGSGIKPGSNERRTIREEERRGEVEGTVEAESKVGGEEDISKAEERQIESLIVNGYYKKFFVEERRIGVGGYGTVFLCRHHLNDLELGMYAVKKVAVGTSASWLVKVLKEVKNMETVQHQNVVAFKHAWLERYASSVFCPEVPYLFILMSFANGGNLSDLLHLDAKPKDRVFLSNEELWRLFHDICSGLSHLHECGIIHRDIKPPNLLLHVEKTALPGVHRKRVLISDFGTSEVLKGMMRTKPGEPIAVESGARMWWMGGGSGSAREGSGEGESERERQGCTGTLGYMAPELLQQDEGGHFIYECSVKSDVWSLGCVLYAMAFSKELFGDCSPPETSQLDLAGVKAAIRAYKGDIEIPSFPPRPNAILSLISRCLALRPQDRPTMEELVESDEYKQMSELVAKMRKRSTSTSSSSSPSKGGTHTAASNSANAATSSATAAAQRRGRRESDIMHSGLGEMSEMQGDGHAERVLVQKRRGSVVTLTAGRGSDEKEKDEREREEKGEKKEVVAISLPSSGPTIEDVTEPGENARRRVGGSSAWAEREERSEERRRSSGQEEQNRKEDEKKQAVVVSKVNEFLATPPLPRHSQSPVLRLTWGGDKSEGGGGERAVVVKSTFPTAVVPTTVVENNGSGNVPLPSHPPSNVKTSPLATSDLPTPYLLFSLLSILLTAAGFYFGMVYGRQV